MGKYRAMLLENRGYGEVEKNFQTLFLIFIASFVVWFPLGLATIAPQPSHRWWMFVLAWIVFCVWIYRVHMKHLFCLNVRHFRIGRRAIRSQQCHERVMAEIAGQMRATHMRLEQVKKGKINEQSQ